MKRFLLSLSVLCAHLALLGGLQLSQHHAQPEPVPTPVQTRQIVESAPSQPPITQATRRRSESGLTRLVPELTRETAAAPAPPSVMTAPKLDASSSVPLSTSGGDNATHLSAKSENSARATASLTDVESTGKAASSTGVQLPSSHAEYLNNPLPPYPALSLRLHETGRVVVRVLIGKNGQALDGHVVQSSGFDRLDQSALKATLAWRYVPGKVDGQARDMWFDVPISFNPTP